MAERYLSVEEFENITRNIRKRIDAVYAKSAFIDASSGVSDAGKPIKLNSSGLIDLSMIPSTLTGKDADTVDGFHLDQDVRTTASPTFSKLTIYDAYGGVWNMGLVQRNGKVGINTSSPAYTLDVDGDIHTSSALHVDSNISVGGDFRNSYIKKAIFCDSRDFYKYGLSFDDNLLALAVERGYTVTASESPDVNSLGTIFNGHPGYAAYWYDANTTYPLIITISNFGTVH